MNKILSFFLFLCFFSFSDAEGQSIKRRHIPGENAISVIPGYNQDGFELDLSYLWFKPQKLSYSFVFTPRFGEVGPTNYKSFNVGTEVYKELFNTKRTFFISVFIGASGGFEFYKNNALSMSDRAFCASLYAGPEFEYCLSNHYSLLCQFHQNFNIFSELGNYTYSIGVGIRYTL